MINPVHLELLWKRSHVFALLDITSFRSRRMLVTFKGRKRCLCCSLKRGRPSAKHARGRLCAEKKWTNLPTCGAISKVQVLRIFERNPARVLPRRISRKKNYLRPVTEFCYKCNTVLNQFTYIWSRPKNSNSTHSGWLNSCVQSKTVSSEQEHTQCNLKSRTLLDVDTQKASPSRTKVWLKMHRDFLYEDTTFANAEDFNAGKWS